MAVVADRRTVSKSAVGFLLAGLLLYALGQLLNTSAVLAVVSTASLPWLALAVASSALCLVTWAEGWGLVLRTVGVRLPLPSLVVAYYAASFVNYSTPLGQTSGAPVSAYVLSTDHRVPYPESLASVVTATGLNVAPMLTFAGVGALALVLEGTVPDLFQPVLLAGGAAVVSFPLVAYGLYDNRFRVIEGSSRIAGWCARRTALVDADVVDRQVGNVLLLLERVGSSRARVAQVLVLSYVGWALFAAPMWFVARSLGVTLSPLLVAFVVPASTLASVVPTPGGIGGVEPAIVVLLTTFGDVPVATAAGIALLHRLTSYWFVVATGAVAAGWVGWR